MGGETVFVVRDVVKRYGARAVLSGITFDIRRGEILGLIGASGAGKTTLLHMLVGFIPATSGEIIFREPHTQREWDVRKDSAEMSRHYGFASQQPSFYERLTVLENLRYFGAMYDMAAPTVERNADQLLRFMSLKSSAHLLAQELSGGMKRRLDIACALIHSPPVLILDEPTADLDPVLRSQIWEVLKQVNAQGTTVVLSSHHLNDLDALCKRIAIVKDGALADIDTPERLKSKYSGVQEIMVESFPGDYAALIPKLRGEGVLSVTRAGTYLTVRTRNVEAVIGRLLPLLRKEKESLLDLKLIKPNIDDVFVRISKGAAPPHDPVQDIPELLPLDWRDA